MEFIVSEKPKRFADVIDSDAKHSKLRRHFQDSRFGNIHKGASCLSYEPKVDNFRFPGDAAFVFNFRCSKVFEIKIRAKF